MKKIFGFLGNDVFLGTLIALLSICTAVSSYQGAMADSDQNKYEILGMQALNDGNAEYLTSNQEITQDYSYYDTWYINQETNPDIAEYFQAEFSDELEAAIKRAGSENPFDEAYYTAKYEVPSGYFDNSDAKFALGSQWDERGDQLQLVILIMTLGLVFAAWAALLNSESNIRLVFSFLGLITFIGGLIIYFTQVPTVIS